jgi:hypothetical protein
LTWGVALDMGGRAAGRRLGCTAGGRASISHGDGWTGSVTEGVKCLARAPVLWMV